MPPTEGPPPDALVRSLVEGPAIVGHVAWFDEIDSTNRVAADAARDGTAEGLLLLADTQTAGRGRMGREWIAPPGTSLLLSLLLRPDVPPQRWPLLSLLTGLALAESVGPHVPASAVALKWPNDLLVDGRKAAGILLEVAGDAAVVGVGVDVDWRGVERSEELAGATSLAEAKDGDVDRWRILAGFLGVLSRRYAEWRDDPQAFLPEYRQRCATIGTGVSVTTRAESRSTTGQATGVDDDGALLVRSPDGTTLAVRAGDVEHVRAG